MSKTAQKLNFHIKTVERQKSSAQKLKMSHSQHSQHSELLPAIIEGFVDGVLILTRQGNWIHANESARRICHLLSSERLQSNLVPRQLWQICESLIESRELFPEERMIIEAEIDMKNAGIFRTRVRWLEIDENDSPYLLVTIEDRKLSTQNTAIAEAKKYDLTPREAEVWLLRRANYSYKEIAAKLYITLNTVKKHMKNVYAKQQATLWSEDAREIG
ncbi:MAG TPA: LuxR C-terminal-related transcriptional regulator [Coleofasciculaceae cyanobacterium]